MKLCRLMIVIGSVGGLGMIVDESKKPAVDALLYVVAGKVMLMFVKQRLIQEPVMYPKNNFNMNKYI